MKLLSIPELIRRVLIFTRTLNMPLLDTLRPPLFTTWTSPNRQWGFSMGIIKDYSSCAVGLFLLGPAVLSVIVTDSRVLLSVSVLHWSP